MNNMRDPFEVGNIVRLKEPYKPELYDSPFDTATRDALAVSHDPSVVYDRINEWPGFTHGVIVEVVSRQGHFSDSPARNVSLHLYDPQQSVIYMGPNAIPSYVDFNVSELELHKVATENGYASATS